MPTITTNDRAAAARADFIDSMLIRMQTPIASTDSQGRIMLSTMTGRPITRTPSREALDWSGATLPELLGLYLKAVAPHARDKISRTPTPTLVELCLSRTRLASIIRPAGGIVLAGSTGDVPGLLADTLGKAMATRYATARRTWRAFARQRLVADFHEQARVRLPDFDLPLELAPGDDVQFDRIEEDGAEPMVLATFARGVKLTRKMLMNDDIGALAEIPAGLVEAAARLEDSLAFNLLDDNPTLDDGVTLFHSDRGNVVDGALDANNFATARARMSRQSTTDSTPLDLVGRHLVTPPELSATAETISRDSAQAEHALDEQPVRIASSPFITQGDRWYLSTDPATGHAAAEVAFLRDQPEPAVAEKIDFESDSMKIRVTHNVAAGVNDPRAIVRGEPND